MENKQKKSTPDPSAQDMLAKAQEIVRGINAEKSADKRKNLIQKFKDHNKEFKKLYGQPLHLEFLPNKEIHKIKPYRPVYRPGEYKPHRKGEMVAKGGMIQKNTRPQMKHGGMYKGKQHSYVAGGAVKDVRSKK